MIRDVLRTAFVVYLVFPFLFLFYQFGFGFQFQWTELWWAFKNSVYQASISSLGSLFFGFWVALGLIAFPKKSSVRSFLDALCLAPNFLPVLFVLLAVLVTVPSFPMGIMGIAIVHIVINFGLVAVILATRLESQLGPYVEVAHVLGAGRIKVLRQIVLPLMRRDLGAVALFVFVTCFGSFAVPLIVGGGKGTTLEVLIYEKIRLTNEWSGAVVLAALQSTFIFSLSFLLMKNELGQAHEKGTLQLNLKQVSFKSGIIILILTMIILGLGYFKPYFDGSIGVVEFYTEIGLDLWVKMFGTIAIAVMTGILIFAGLAGVAYLSPSRWFSRFLNSYLAPSTALACFALLVIAPNGGSWAYFKIPSALFMLYFSSLFRLSFKVALDDLKNQQQVAQIMGASPVLIFKKIYWPQLFRLMLLLSTLGAVWACGDYAVSRILASKTFTLAMMTDTLMSSYRLQQAVILSGSILMVGIVLFVAIMGGLHVFGQRYSVAKK